MLFRLVDPFGRDPIVFTGSANFSEASSTKIKGAKLIVDPGAPHGFGDTHKDQFNADLLAFIKG